MRRTLAAAAAVTVFAISGAQAGHSREYVNAYTAGALGDAAVVCEDNGDGIGGACFDVGPDFGRDFGVIVDVFDEVWGPVAFDYRWYAGSALGPWTHGGCDGAANIGDKPVVARELRIRLTSIPNAPGCGVLWFPASAGTIGIFG